MKKKVALLLALVMVVSMLPMQAFGRQPGQITPRPVPHGTVENYVVAIDAAWLSEVSTITQLGQEPRRLFLEVEISHANNVGIHGAPTLAPGFGFATSPAALTADFVADLAALGPWQTSGGDGRGAGNIGIARVPLDTLLVPETIVLGPPVQAIVPNSVITPMTLFSAGMLGAITLAELQAADFNDLPINHPVREAINIAVNGLANNTIGGNWMDQGGHIQSTVDGTVTGQLTHWNDTLIYADFPAGPLVPNESTIYALPQMSGWLNLTLPIMADAPNVQLTVRLRFEVPSTGATGTIATLADGQITGGWAGGVNITSQGIVPLVGYAVLRAVRLTEQVPGRLRAMYDGTAASGANPVAGTMRHIVRLEAPRGFRWDVGTMFGMGTTGLRTSSNLGNNATANVLPPVSGSTALTWVNPQTNLHEIFVELVVPRRGTNLGDASTLAFVDIQGLALVAVAGAPTTGNVAVDVTVGTIAPSGVGSNHGSDQGFAQFSPAVGAIAGGYETGFFYVWHPDVAVEDRDASIPWHVIGRVPMPPVFVAGTGVTQPSFGFTTEAWRQGNWRQTGLIVASLDHEFGLTVDGPASPANRLSGRVSDTINMTDRNHNDRFLHRGYHSLRITELHPGGLFDIGRPTIYELRVVQPGVHIVDARVRGRRGNADIAVGNIADDGAAYASGWQLVETNNTNFVTAMTEFNGGSVTFAARAIGPDTQAYDRSLEVGLMLSVEAGFEANHGGVVEVAVYRNNFYIGTAHVANITDPIASDSIDTLRISRDAFDVLALTEAGGFVVSETAVGNLRNGDELWFRLEATQDGRRVNIPGGQMVLHLGPASVNYEESNLFIEPITVAAGNELQAGSVGFRVVRPSRDVPGTITFDSVYVAGPTVPGLDWHVVVTSPQHTANHHYHMPPRLSRNTLQERAVFYTMPYSSVILEVRGAAIIDPSAPGFAGAGGRMSFTTGTMVDVDGVTIQAIHFHMVSGTRVTKMNGRVFADFAGGRTQWNAATNTATFSGYTPLGEEVVVELTTGSPVAVVNGQHVDIATGARQPQFAGQIVPVIEGGRQFVPVRFLANMFGIPIDVIGGGENMTIVLG